MLRFFLVLSALFALVVPAVAQENGKRTAVTIDDYFTLATPTEVRLSPDLRFVAYAESRWKKSTNDRKTDLWIVERSTKKVTRLTGDRPNARSLRWSPDENYLYHLGSRKRAGETAPPYDGTTQVWKTAVSDGRSVAVTRYPGGIVAYDLDDAAKTLVFVVNAKAKATGTFAALKQETSQIQFDDGAGTVSKVFRLDLETWRQETLHDEGRFVREIALTPEGDKVALITAPDDTVVTFEGQSRVEVVDLKTKKTVVLPDKCYRAVAASKFGWLEHLVWGPGPMNRLAFNVIFDGYPAQIVLGEQGDSTWETWTAERPDKVHIGGYGSNLAWMDRNEVWFIGEEKANARLWKVRADKRETKASEAGITDDLDICVSDLHTRQIGGKQGRCAFIAGTKQSFREVWVGGANEHTKRLTDLNPQTKTWQLPKVSVVSWKGAGGALVQGVLELPHDAKPGEPLPLVVAIHGGPTAAVRSQLEYDMYLGRVFLPARGYAVLCPNYRGSTGYGDKFLTDLLGKENDIEVTDILKGVDALVEKKIADPKRLAVMGWSNGGYLTNCVISQTTRFKAASSGASIVDAVMQWGANDEPAYMAVLKGGLPWEKPDVYRKTSPTYKLDKITTPTLIHVGGNDVRCPPGHSRMLYRALKVYNKVPTELLVYPGEPHGLGKYANRRAKMQWDVAWFDRYVLGK